jgi:hypothetical protein
MMKRLRIFLVGLFLSLPCTAAFAQAIYSFNYLNITGQATTPVRTGPGVLHTVCFNNPTATEVITLWDSLTAAGTKIGTITIPASPQPVCLVYDVAYGTGLTVQTATASSDITVSYR